jgi:hypothetical protein
LLVASRRFDGSRSRKTKGSLADTLLEEGSDASPDDLFDMAGLPSGSNRGVIHDLHFVDAVARAHGRL